MVWSKVNKIWSKAIRLFLVFINKKKNFEVNKNVISFSEKMRDLGNKLIKPKNSSEDFRVIVEYKNLFEQFLQDGFFLCYSLHYFIKCLIWIRKFIFPESPTFYFMWMMLSFYVFLKILKRCSKIIYIYISTINNMVLNHN